MAQTVGFSRALATVRRTVAARRDAKRRARAVRIPPCSPCIVCRKNKKQHPAGCCLWRRRWDSNPRDIAVKLISSLLCNCDGDVRFGGVSVSPVPAENRMKSGFFARKVLRDRLFWKWVQIGIFPDLGEKCGKIGEKNRETAIHRRIELPTDENLFLRCYKWMYFPSTGTAFPR